VRGCASHHVRLLAHHHAKRLISKVKRISCAVAIFAVACVTWTSADQAHWAGSLRSAPLAEGIAQTFSSDLATTVRAAQQAVLAIGLEPDRDCPEWLNRGFKNVGEGVRCLGPTFTRIDEHTAVFDAMKFGGSGTKRWCNGDQVRVLVQELVPGQSTVRILSKFRTHTIVGRSGDYSSAIFDQVSRQLKQ